MRDRIMMCHTTTPKLVSNKGRKTSIPSRYFPGETKLFHLIEYSELHFCRPQQTFPHNFFYLCSALRRNYVFPSSDRKYVSRGSFLQLRLYSGSNRGMRIAEKISVEKQSKVRKIKNVYSIPGYDKYISN